LHKKYYFHKNEVIIVNVKEKMCFYEKNQYFYKKSLTFQNVVVSFVYQLS